MISSGGEFGIVPNHNDIDLAQPMGADPSIRRPKYLVSDIDTIVVCLPRDVPEGKIPLILGLAALYRVTAQSSDAKDAPEVILGYESVLQDYKHSELLKVPQAALAKSNRNLLLVGFESFKKEHLAQFILDQALLGSSVVGALGFSSAPLAEALEIFGESIDALSFKPETKKESRGIAAMFGEALSPYLDEISRTLLKEAGTFEKGEASPLLLDLRKALFVAQAFSWSFLLSDDERHLAIDERELIHNIIISLAESRLASLKITELVTRYDESIEASKDYVAGAIKLSPGIFSLTGSPYNEQDKLIRDMSEKLIKESKEMLVVLEHRPDNRATGLSKELALELKVRLEQGESERILFEELQEALSKAADTTHSMLNQLEEDRGHDLREVIHKEIERANYDPDPEGIYTIKKAPDNLDLGLIFKKALAPFVEHNMFWLHDLNTGKSKPVVYQFRASYLPQILGALEEALTALKNPTTL